MPLSEKQLLHGQLPQAVDDLVNACQAGQFVMSPNRSQSDDVAGARRMGRLDSGSANPPA
jgi:hypothetical protein